MRWHIEQPGMAMHSVWALTSPAVDNAAATARVKRMCAARRWSRPALHRSLRCAHMQSIRDRFLFAVCSSVLFACTGGDKGIG